MEGVNKLAAARLNVSNGARFEGNGLSPYVMQHAQLGLLANKPTLPVTRTIAAILSLLREEHLGCRRSNHKRADDLGPILKAS
jgi:hypothetical protein